MLAIRGAGLHLTATCLRQLQMKVRLRRQAAACRIQTVYASVAGKIKADEAAGRAPVVIDARRADAVRASRKAGNSSNKLFPKEKLLRVVRREGACSEWTDHTQGTALIR